MTRTFNVHFCLYTVCVITFEYFLTTAKGHTLEFVVEPSDTVVQNGHTAVLDCVAKSGDFPSNTLNIQWLDQDKQVLSFIGETYRSQLTNGSLYIGSVTEEQGLTGNYQCMVSLPNNAGSIVSRTAKLSLASLSGFLQEPRDITVYPGQRAHFACLVQASPPPRIKWLKDERPLQLDELRMVVLPSGSLEIDEVQEPDQGSYRCNASGLNAYRLSNKAALIVNGDQEQANSPMPPSFITTPHPQVAIEGQTIYLDCAANGNPNPIITWLKDGRSIDMADLDSRFSIVPSTSTLSISNIKEEDAGTYQCRAENRGDSSDAPADIQVQVPPRFRKKPVDKVEVIKKDVELECSVYGKPEPTIQWYKNGEMITLNEYYQLADVSNLKIMGLMTDDTGLFQCVASNPAGNVQASAFLKVVESAEEAATTGRADESQPGPPRDLSAPVVNARFVVLSWKSPATNNEDIITYFVYYKQNGSKRERVQNATRSRLEEINIGGLQPDRVYHFRVVAYNSNGPGESSEQLTVKTQSEEHVPSSPKQFRAFATSPRSIHCSWVAPDNPKGNIQRYKIYYMETSSSTEHNIETTKLEFDITSLLVYTEYNIWVVAINNNGPGAATEEITIRTYGAAPSDPPDNVTLECTSSTTVLVRWEPPPLDGQNGPITGYKIRYKKTGGKKGDTVTTPGNTLSFQLENLDRGSEYQVKLWAFNVNGSSPATEWFNIETYENDLDESRVPDSPGPLRVRAFADRVYIVWTPPANQNIKVRNYILGWGKGVPDLYTHELDEKTRNHYLDRLDPNSEYVISLRASNEMGAGAPTYTTFRTMEEQAPESQVPLIPPVALKAQTLSPTSMVLFWSDNTQQQFTRDNRYYVVRYRADQSSKMRYLNVSDHHTVVPDLKPNTNYEFSVKLVKGKRESYWSMLVRNKTWDNPPNTAPRELTVKALESDSQIVELNWLPPKQSIGHVTGYVILYTKDKAQKERDWMVKAVKADKNSLVLSDLQTLTTYYFKMQARNDRGYGPFTQVVSFKTGSHFVVLASATSNEHLDGRTIFSDTMLLYLIIGGTIITLATIAAVSVFLCCRRREPTGSPDRSKKGYQKGNQNIKPPDLWIHHDQMELKEKGHSNNDGASSSGAMTLPRSVGANDYDTHDSHHSNSLDKRTYVPNYGASPDDKNKRVIKPKPINLPVDCKPPREPIATATPINTTSLSQTSSDSTPSSRPPYPRTQYTISRAHVTLDQGSHQPVENPYASHTSHVGYDSGPSSTSGYVSAGPPPIAHVPPASAYAPGMSVLAESQAGKRIQGQGHPLKSFTVPAPPPISAPGTPQAKHIVTPQPQITVRANASPYKKAPSSGSSTLTSTPPSRISASNPPPHTAEEVQRLQPSHSTEELNQEMANLEGLMMTLNAITANEFEC